MRIEKTNTETIIYCGPAVDLLSVVEQKAILLQALEIKKPICLEAGEISKIDTAGIQLLLNFILTAAKANLRWRWKNPSLQLINTSELLGLDQVLAFKQGGGA